MAEVNDPAAANAANSTEAVVLAEVDSVVLVVEASVVCVVLVIVFVVLSLVESVVDVALNVDCVLVSMACVVPRFEFDCKCKRIHVVEPSC